MFIGCLDIFFCQVSTSSLTILLLSFLPAFGFVGASHTFQPSVHCVTHMFSQASLTPPLSQSFLLLTLSLWALATMQTDGEIFLILWCSRKRRTTPFYSLDKNLPMPGTEQNTY